MVRGRGGAVFENRLVSGLPMLEMLHGKMPATEEQTSSPEASRLACGSACRPSGKFSSPDAAALSKPRERIPFPMVNFLVERPIWARQPIVGCYRPNATAQPRSNLP